MPFPGRGPRYPDGSTPEPPAEQTTEELQAVDELQAHRFGRYRELGFTDIGAHLLSVAKDDAGFYLWWGHVKAALERGCTHAQAIAIWT